MRESSVEKAVELYDHEYGLVNLQVKHFEGLEPKLSSWMLSLHTTSLSSHCLASDEEEQKKAQNSPSRCAEQHGQPHVCVEDPGLISTVIPIGLLALSEPTKQQQRIERVK